MKIVQITLYRIEIPLKMAFRHALKIRLTSQSVVVEVVTESGIHGYGEGTPREYVTSETIGKTVSQLARAGALITKEAFSERDARECFSGRLASLDLNDKPSTRCALELALMDAWGKYSGTPLALQVVSAPISRFIRFSGVVSGEDLNATQQLLLRVREFGFEQVKVKVDQNHSLNLERLALARRILGPDVDIRVDVNGAWELSEAIENSQRFSSLGISTIEQPLAADARDDYPRLMERIDPDRINIILDESICTKSDAKWFISHKGASGFNLKISKHGGFWPTYCVYEMARKAGMSCQLGCHVGETALLTAAGRNFATIAPDLKAFEGSYGRFLLEHDITSEDMTFGPGGVVDLSSLLTRPGLGVSVDRELLRKSAEIIEIF